MTERIQSDLLGLGLLKIWFVSKLPVVFVMVSVRMFSLGRGGFVGTGSCPGMINVSGISSRKSLFLAFFLVCTFIWQYESLKLTCYAGSASIV